MKKLGTLSLLVLLMVTLTGCTPKKDNIQNNKETNKESKETNSANEETFSGTMEELLKLGKNYKCTFSTTTELDTATGEVYASGDKIASTTKIKSGEMDIVANSIMDKEWVYTWNNTTPTGIKAKISDIPDTKNETQDYLENNKEEKGQIIDTKEKMDYKCSAWNVDNSKFELPKNIEFKDTSEIMKDFVQKENGEGVCKACDMAPDEKTKTECKKSLGC